MIRDAYYFTQCNNMQVSITQITLQGLHKVKYNSRRLEIETIVKWTFIGTLKIIFWKHYWKNYNSFNATYDLTAVICSMLTKCIQGAKTRYKRCDISTAVTDKKFIIYSFLTFLGILIIFSYILLWYVNINFVCFKLYIAF